MFFILVNYYFQPSFKLRPGSYVTFLPCRIQLDELNSTEIGLPHFCRTLDYYPTEMRHRFNRRISVVWNLAYTYGLLTKCEVKMAGYWPSSFFACLWTETSINSQKWTRPIFSNLDRTNLVNKGFIIWLLVKFCSGSQSQRAIWFILPARGACHIMNYVIAFSMRKFDPGKEKEETWPFLSQRSPDILQNKLLHCHSSPRSIGRKQFSHNLGSWFLIFSVRHIEYSTLK